MNRKPVAWIPGYMGRIIANGGAWDSFSASKDKLADDDFAIYIEPPMREPLKNEQIENIRIAKSNVIINQYNDKSDFIEFARLIEKAHGIE